MWCNFGSMYINIPNLYNTSQRMVFVVVNFDALAQASDIQIERRQVVFLCWIQNLNPGSQTPNRQQTECSLTNRLSYRGSSKNLNSTARPYDQRAFSPLDPIVSWLSHLALAIYGQGALDKVVVYVMFLFHWWRLINTLRPGQNCFHFKDDFSKRILTNGNVWISFNISPKFVPRSQLTIFQHWFG